MAEYLARWFGNLDQEIPQMEHNIFEIFGMSIVGTNSKGCSKFLEMHVSRNLMFNLNFNQTVLENSVELCYGSIPVNLSREQTPPTSHIHALLFIRTSKF